jgi:hypothetical protein
MKISMMKIVMIMKITGHCDDSGEDDDDEGYCIRMRMSMIVKKITILIGVVMNDDEDNEK